MSAGEDTSASRRRSRHEYLGVLFYDYDTFVLQHITTIQFSLSLLSVIYFLYLDVIKFFVQIGLFKGDKIVT